MNKDKDTVISLHDVAVGYKKRGRRHWLPWKRGDLFWALNGVSFDIHKGEALGVIGRNGAGKTTLLRVLAGIISPDRGTIEKQQCEISMLSLKVGFARYLTGRENVILSGLLLGLDRKEINERMQKIVEFAELEDFIDEPIGTYSSGMQARLGFSVAFHINPDVLLVDETLSVGDKAFQEKSSRIMHEKIRSNTTVVLVSHNAKTVCELCDRAIWLDKGRVRLIDTPEKVLDRYERPRRKT